MGSQNDGGLNEATEHGCWPKVSEAVQYNMDISFLIRTITDELRSGFTTMSQKIISVATPKKKFKVFD